MISVPPEGGARSQLEVRTAPGPRLASETNNDCQVKFELLHKSQAVRRLIRSAGAKLFFLPRYSPDLNPIEQVFAKLKTLLRKRDPRTTEATWRGIGALLDHFSPTECANYLANAGYAST